MHRLRGKSFGWLVPVGGIELAQITRDTFIKLCPTPFHLRAREVLVPVVHRLELAAVDGNACCRKKTHRAAQLHKTRAPHLAPMPGPLSFEEIRGDRLVIGHKPP